MIFTGLGKVNSIDYFIIQNFSMYNATLMSKLVQLGKIFIPPGLKL